MENDEQTARIFHALSHSRRVAILRLMLARDNTPIAVGALQRELKIPAASLSHHLQIMERAGVVLSRAKGRFTMYRLDLGALTRHLAQMQNQIAMLIPDDGVQNPDLPDRADVKMDDGGNELVDETVVAKPAPKIQMPTAPPPTKRYYGLRG